ncbi:metallophosphoesterase [Nonomuraea sp. NBC_01738]|uniref:metallophosphoesterase family protein n=1 Tax=Nonomuraea sp. NBC_01738 TaxID=2976003 RepID=UPI002E110BA1|nr:metallophosphoesterase [Nonomuraea sp. NBC_01738]
MRVHVVSDVHGSVEALALAGEGADALVCLGDLILYIDYENHAQGIFADLFGADNAAAFIALRTAKRFDEARAMSAELWKGLGGDPREHVEANVRRQYRALFDAMPEPAYLTYGNVDVPRLWPDYLRPGHTVLDGQVIELGGLRFGFVGGGLKTPYRTPHEIPDEEYAAKVEALGEVDVLCTHIPPAVPELLYDVVARRFERGSEATLDLIRRTQPRYALFGHVHQPLYQRYRIGRTECVNVGHFRGRGRPYVLEW